MIFYFTGTGNSLWVAKKLQASLNETLYPVSRIINEQQEPFSFSISAEEKIIFVFPVHSWGPPGIMTRFINKLLLQNYQSQPVYAVCTCGDDCGYTEKMFAKCIHEKKWFFKACYSITMPNNYILFPGFDIDTPEKENEKLSHAAKAITSVSNSICQDKPLELYTRGSMPFIKSRIIHPLFNKYALGKNAFYYTADCISCGLCERICPTQTIFMKEGKPHWKDTCIQCVACIHRCPEHAIEYGKVSIGKGRYHHPEIK